MEEIKLLKDYVYGIDPKAKDVHKYKFIDHIASDKTLSVDGPTFASNESKTIFC